ncbi:MAG: hypothetical protein H0X30_04635 [Anaerolineae bacterium]|nr:hypothetical protein [Anaerolineae bacterium]
MGVDIHGWVEMKAWDDKWEGVLRIDEFVYHQLGSIFVDNGIFQPILKGRGLPNDVSKEVKGSNPEEDWGHTWAYWYEIMNIDWEEVYTPPSPRIIKYVRHTPAGFLLDWHGYLHEMKDPPALDYTKEGDTEIGDTMYRIIHEPSVRRNETLSTGWQLVFDTMRFLATQQPNNNDKLRLVVWFNG